MITATLLCALTTVVDLVPDQPWIEQDYLAFDTAKERCQVYYPDSPCLSKFIRVQIGRYQVTCSRSQNET